MEENKFIFEMIRLDALSLESSRCFMTFLFEEGRYYPVDCDVNFCKAYICEFADGNTKNMNNVALKVVPIVRRQELLQCKLGHLTLDFLHCDVKSYCGLMRSQRECHIQRQSVSENNDVTSARKTHVEMFECVETRETIPYTLVCDFRRHCLDGADESFCLHSSDQSGFV